MTMIVCATNAGEDSRSIHIAAFEKAAEIGASLTFVHVIGGSDFFEQPERMREAIREEMDWLLHALVGVAQDRSGASDVESSVVLRTGDPRTELLAYLSEHDAATLLVGVPRAGDTSIFSGSGFEEFVADAEGMGARVELVATDSSG
jgi:nucleotide-binding universal stress UspA family protein